MTLNNYTTITNYNTWRRNHISPSWCLCGSSIPVEFGYVSFCRGRKTGESREKPSEQGMNLQQTQPTQDYRQELNPDHIGGR